MEQRPGDRCRARGEREEGGAATAFEDVASELRHLLAYLGAPAGLELERAVASSPDAVRALTDGERIRLMDAVHIGAGRERAWVYVRLLLHELAHVTEGTFPAPWTPDSAAR